MKDILIKLLAEQLQASGVRDYYSPEEIEERVDTFMKRENL